MSEKSQTSMSREEFLQNLAESGLARAAEVLTAANQVTPGEAGEGATLAALLVARGHLTAFQADAVLFRRFNVLRIGNYEILDRLGAGGMGTVFKASHRRMKRIVALKVLSREVAQSHSFEQRFQREVETIAKLTHPNIVMAFDADEAESGPFLVMEFVSGHDLANEVAKNGALSPADAVECILQAAKGLEYAHSQGIVHRDIKPGNVLRDSAGVIKVADLGLARLSGPDGRPGGNTSLTQAGGIVGTMDYMPPEQALDSTAIDHRADVYSLGCTLHFLLTGRPPYAGGSIMALLLKHREAAIPSLREVRADVPPELDAIFQRMVAKNPNDRYTTMTEVVRALDDVKRSIPLGTTRLAKRPPQPGHDTDLTGPTVSIDAARAKVERVMSAPGPTSMGAVPTASQVGQVAGRTIVLVEPSRTQAGIIRRYLNQLEIDNVHVTGTGREAIELAKRERADAIVASMHLSDMTGLDLAELLVGDQTCEGIGFVLATSETDSEAATAIPDNHPRVARMLKPYDLQRLAQCIAQVSR